MQQSLLLALEYFVLFISACAFSLDSYGVLSFTLFSAKRTLTAKNSHDWLVLVIVTVASLMQICLLADTAIVIITFNNEGYNWSLLNFKTFGALMSPLTVFAAILQLFGLLAYYWLTALKYNKFVRGGDIIADKNHSRGGRMLERLYINVALPILTIM